MGSIYRVHQQFLLALSALFGSEVALHFYFASILTPSYHYISRLFKLIALAYAGI
ncbi:MAG: nitrate/nitrite transporter NarK [Glaciecola sp.]|jgi:nitrate/nitrite transporter NarK